MNTLKLALRSLFKTPGFTLIAIVTLSLGIGLNTSMFSLMNTLLLRPLPFPDSERLVKLHRASPQDQDGDFSPADYLDLKREEAGFGQFAAYHYWRTTMSVSGQPAELLHSFRVSADFFHVLGVQPEIGRLFYPEEEVRGNHHVIIITQALWQDRFGGATNIIGRTIRLDGEIAEIVGVLPASVHDPRFFGESSVFCPLSLSDQDRATRGAQWLTVLGRRDRTVSSGQGSAFIASFGARMAADFPAENAKSLWRSEGLRESTMNPRGRTLLLMLLGLSGFVLLIACSNLANFLIARSMSRLRDLAVRAALGASRLQLIYPLALESLLLAAAGGAGALAVSDWSSTWLSSQIPKTGGLPTTFAMDWRVLGFAFGMSFLTILFFGIAPALFTARVNTHEALKSGSHGATASHGHKKVRHLLIVGQFALGMILAAGAGFFVRGTKNLFEQEHGWDAAHVVQASLQLPAEGYSGENELAAFYQRLTERLEQLPGVESASVSYALPYRGLKNSGRYIIEGCELPPPGQEPSFKINGVSPSYFTVTGTRLINGRVFSDADTASSAKVGIINEMMARTLFPNDNPIGHRVARAGSNQPEWIEIVGVVADARSVDAADGPVAFQLYRPIVQEVWRYFDGKPAETFLAVRTANASLESVISSVRADIAAFDPDLPMRDLMSANSVIESVSLQMRLFRKLLIGFALLGLLLAGLGIYGVIARTAAQRTGEIGIRMALGAESFDVIRLILGSGLRLALTGAGIGFLGALGLARLLASILPGMQANGGLVLTAATAILMGIAFLACYLPARKASRIDPASALRAE